ncbi:MAG: beta-galactosidase [Candidatus Acidiferrales bacterium]
MSLRRIASFVCVWCFALAALGLARAQQPAPPRDSDSAAVAAAEKLPLLLGTDWYPEQWPESRWDADLQLMEAAHIHVVRITEFAWSTMEPSEGHYNFVWLDHAIAAAARHNIFVVLGTPTATPPAWLTTKYPETLRILQDGRRDTHGTRQQDSITSPLYLRLSRGIVEQMATRYGHNPDVVGWQIDNEYGGIYQISYDDVTRQKFHEWLQAKYKTLANLNDHWTTAYWSQTYDAWSEIPIPIGGTHNPGLRLDWNRYVTAAWDIFQRNQIDVIRAHSDPHQFITTNFMGFFDGFDHYVMSKPLTFAAWDNYVGSGHVPVDSKGLAHDLTRGFKQRNFWVIETQPGAVNWHAVNNFLNKGEVRAMAWQDVGHGADEVGYWQWRSALNGQEQYHGTLIGADGAPVPLYDEVAQLGRDFAAIGTQLAGTTPVSQVALLHSYDSRWAISFQRHSADYDPITVMTGYYRALRRLTQSVDVVNPYAPLNSYKLVVAPNLNVMPQDMAQHLLEYVQNGGHLVLGPRSGMKDQFNALLTQRQPGYLVDALGGRVEQYYALEKGVPVSGNFGDGVATIWAEQLSATAPDTQVLARYGKSNGWLDGQPAVITRKVGKGSITYIGALLDDDLLAAAAQWMVQDSGVTPALGPVPDGIEVCPRSGNGKQFYILINWAPEARHVSLPHAMDFLLAGTRGDSLDLDPYGVEVLLDSK